MRYYFWIILLLIMAFFASRLISMILKGKLFEEGAFKKELKESGKTLWLGMRLFVVIWLLYLLLVQIVSNR